MRNHSEHEYTTYPRRFAGYRWYKPLLVALVCVCLYFAAGLVIPSLTKVLFGQTVGSSGYDDMDLFSGAGAFENCVAAAVIIPILMIASRTVKDRPFSSYSSSMGGWRRKIFLKTLGAAFVIMGIPKIVTGLLGGRTGDIRFTLIGFVIITLIGPFQGIAEEYMYRGYLLPTVSSWFRLPAAGVVFQILLFALSHPYNVIGVVNIAYAALIYALVCMISKGLESGSALHMINNMTEIYMVGFGFGAIQTEQSIHSVAVEMVFKTLFLAFILYADRKLGWFDEVIRDDAAEFSSAD